MPRFSSGDRVRVDIPDKTDPDYEQYHDRVGTVLSVKEDDAGKTTGDRRDATIYSVEFDDGDRWFFRWRDLRPASE